MKIEYKNGALAISIPRRELLASLAVAAGGQGFHITFPDEAIEAIVRVLNSEQETPPVHEMLDKVVIAAIELGEEAFDENDV